MEDLPLNMKRIAISLLTFVLIVSFLFGSSDLSSRMTNPNPLVQGENIGLPAGIDSTINWTFPAGSLFDSDPVAVDLDTDGTLEVLVGCNNQILYCIDHLGSIEWSYTTDEWILGSPSVADLDKDGSLEIVVGTRGSTLYCFDSDGGIEWTFPSIGWAWSTACLADINLDGYLEILFTTNANMLYCLNNTGDEMWHVNTGNDAEVPPAVGDFDEDGIPDIVVGNHNGRVYCYNSTGHELWNTYAGGGIMNAAFCISDLDVDGHLEIIIGSWDQNIYCIHHNGTERWSFHTGGDIDMSTAAAVDLDDDGTLEVLVGSNDDRLHCIDHNGVEEWYYQTSGNIRGSPMVADLDGDGHLDIVVPSQDNYLYCIDYDGTFNWSENLGGSPWEDPCIADLDGDGVFEIIVSGYSNLQCISLIGVTTSGVAPWPCYLGSTHHTGWIDTDSDFLDDFSEETYYLTYLDQADSDLDTWLDGIEVFAGTNPLNPSDFPFYENYDWVVEGTTIPHPVSGVYDVDEDGKIEVWTTDTSTKYVRVYETNGPNSYVEIWNYSIGPADEWSRDWAWFGDTDNDTKLEVVMNTGTWPSVWHLRIFECDGDNSFSQSFVYDISSFNDPQFPVCGDVDGDGYCEIFIGANDYNVGFFENTGDNSYTYKGTIPDSRTKQIAIGDLDGDSSLDMVLGGEYYDRKVSQWEATGDDTYAVSWETVDDVSTYGSAVKIIDLDLDGFNEIWCSGGNSWVTRLYETTGDNSFVDRWDFNDKGGNDPGFLFDANGNGWPEIAWTSRYSGSGDTSNQEIFIYEATGDNSYKMKWQSGLLSGEEGPVYMGDFDNDESAEMLYHRNSGTILECTVKLGNKPYLQVIREPSVPSQDNSVNVTVIVSSISGINQSILSYSYDGGAFTNISMSNITGWWTGEIPAFPAHTEVQYKVYVQNGTCEWITSALYSYIVADTEGPLISTSRDPIMPIHSEVVTINATVVDASAIEQVLLQYSSDNQETWIEVSMSQVGNNWIEYIPFFLAGTNVSYYVRAEDSEGNWGASDITNYTVDDIQGPSIITSRNVLTPCSGEMVEVSAAIYDTSMVDTSWLLVSINGGPWNSYWMNKVGYLYVAFIPGLDIGTYVEYRVQANDTVGNWGLSPLEAYTVIDCYGPTISLLTEPSDVGQNETVSIEVSVTDPGGVKQVLLCYSLDSGFTFTNTSMSEDSGIWSASIPLGTVGESVYFSIYAEDQTGNWEISVLYTYQIIDVIAPNITSTSRSILTPCIDDMVQVNAIVHDTSVVDSVWLLVRINNGSWNSYRMNKVGDLYSAFIQGQDFGYFVEYRVQAYDSVGNWDVSQIEAYTVTDCVSPIISLQTELSTQGQNVVVPIEVDVADAGGVKQVLLCYSLDSGTTFTNRSMDNILGIWSASIPMGVVGESVYLSIYAEDQSGNWEISQLYSYQIIDVLAPNVQISITTDSSNQTETLTVKVEITDDSEILSVLMRYTVDNWGNESELTLDFQDGVWEIQIGFVDSAMTLQYRIVVEDVAHNIYESGTMFYTIVHSLYQASPLDFTLVAVTSGGIGVAIILIILYVRKKQ